MARVTRSGTLVGPGTKRKWRPAMMNPPFVCRLTLLTKPLAQAQQPKFRASFPFLDHHFQNRKPVSDKDMQRRQGAWPQPTTRMARKSLTLVRVGPVTTRSPIAEKKP